jgi:hypothetical protein
MIDNKQFTLYIKKRGFARLKTGRPKTSKAARPAGLKPATASHAPEKSITPYDTKRPFPRIPQIIHF